MRLPVWTLTTLSRLIAVATALSGYTARAEGDRSFVSLALTATDDVAEANSAKGESATTILNLSAGIGVGSGLEVGFKYFDYNADSKFLGMGGKTISGYGPLLGYLHTSGFFANAAYLVAPIKTDKDANGIAETYSGGSGYVLDVGKVFEISKGFGLALQLSQSNVTYKQQKNAAGTTTNLSGTWFDQSLYPYVAAYLFF